MSDRFLKRTALSPALITEEILLEYTDLAKTYDHKYYEAGAEYAGYSARLLEEFIPCHARVPDAGCGTGLVGEGLKKIGYRHVIGCDISSDMLGVAKEKDIYSQLVEANLFDPLPFGNQQFDAIVCVGTFTHIRNVEPTLREFCRITKNKGIILSSHRDDLYQTWDVEQTCRHLENKKLWKKEFQSEWMPYVPNHPDYGDKIRVSCFVYKLVYSPESHEY